MKTEYICENCGYLTSKWYGKCPQCSEWNTFSEHEQSLENTKKQKTRKTNDTFLFFDTNFNHFYFLATQYSDIINWGIKNKVWHQHTENCSHTSNRLSKVS
jgi:predicted ATP-dependent serine protease